MLDTYYQWFHARTCLVAGVGFFTDAYDIFSISIAASMIGYVYHNGKSNTANQDLGVKVAHSIGTFVGQLLFGWLGDVVGRKKMYGIELVSPLILRLRPRLMCRQIIIIVGTLGTAIAGSSLGISVYGVIIFWRFIMGVGIGGDYPVSSVITSEFAARRIRGRMMAAVFSAQGWGNREFAHSKFHMLHQLIFSRIGHCRGHCRYCFQVKDHQRTSECFDWSRPSLANYHWYWLRSRIHRVILSLDHPRNTSVHHRCRGGYPSGYQ